MRILTLLRADERGVVDGLVERGNTVVMPEHYAALHPKVATEKVEWPDDPHSNNGWFALPINDKAAVYALRCPQTIDAVRKVKPDACVLWTDAPPMLRTVALTCKADGIPTYELTHGSLNTYRQGHFECESFVDTILAPGQEEVDFRAFYGATAKVLPVGKPSYDWIAKTDLRALKADIRRSLNIPERRPVILYGMTWRHQFSTWERDKDIGVGEVVEAHMNLRSVCRPFFIFKPHYSASSPLLNHKIQELCKANGVSDYAIYHGPIRGIMPAADLVVSHKSSLLVEAVLMDIPCVGFDFRERNDFAFYQGKGIEWVADRKALYTSMAKVLLDAQTRIRLAQERESAKHYFNGPNDGNATERVIHAIEGRN